MKEIEPLHNPQKIKVSSLVIQVLINSYIDRMKIKIYKNKDLMNTLICPNACSKMNL